MNVHYLTKYIASVFLLCGCLTAHANGITLSVNVQNATLKQVFSIIEKQTDYRISYRNVFIDNKKDITIHQQNTTVSKVLDKALSGRELSYTIVPPKTIVISDKTRNASTLQPEPQQDKKTKVHGTVTDANGDPIIGASVRINGSSTGVITDINGNYTLEANHGDVVEISYVGFGSKEVRVNNSNLNVTLTEDETTLNDLVVVGYGVVKKSDLTGAIGSVSARSIENIPQSSISNILQGKIAGVNISSTDGGGSMQIRVRGTTSMSKSNEPLWVVDGVIGAPQPSNPDDIQSIEVLKDASSTAVYGAQGANGVILITTKRAQEGMRITFDSRLTWNTARKKAKLLDAYEYATAYNEFNGKYFTDEQLQGWKDGTLESVDWQDAALRTGFNQRYGLSLSGGSKRTKYLVSAAFSDDNSRVVTVNSRNYKIKGQLTTDIANWLTFNGYLYMDGTKGHNTGNGIVLGDASAHFPRDIYYDIYCNSPTRPLKDAATGAIQLTTRTLPEGLTS